MITATATTIEFFDVKTRKKVRVSSDRIRKTRYERMLKDGSKQIRYAFRADYEGRKLTKFCSKSEWENVKAQTE